MLSEVSTPPRSPNTSALGTRMQNPDTSSPLIASSWRMTSLLFLSKLILERRCLVLLEEGRGGDGGCDRGAERCEERKAPRRREANGANDDVISDVITRDAHTAATNGGSMDRTRV
ncbi:hypothetical protein EAG_05311 [Camponotus floridanus]|uniref:Uncharacterized protein n=1 Tax=Camponotus floridanus TaxID=104421 RepID=E2A052_CAMFO|nr:hypothetical protein EAG_05311 [Camponotus floridanus]